MLKIVCPLCLCLMFGQVQAQNPSERPPSNAAGGVAKRMRDQGIRLEANIPYLGKDRKEKMDVYRPAADGDRKRPAVVVIHGGGWTGGSKTDAREIQIAETLCAAGYVCASIDYRLATDANPSWPGVLDDCRMAVKFLRTYADSYGLDPDRIGAIGGSAGGHLALLLGTAEAGPAAKAGPVPKGLADPSQSGRVSIVAALYPPTDLSLLPRTPLIGPANPERQKAASPIHQIIRDFPPAMLIHGTADKTVPITHSQQLAAEMKKLDLKHELIAVEGAGHTFPLKDAGHDHRAKVVQFLDAVLKPPAK